MDDAERLHDLVEIWHRCAADVVGLLRSLTPEEWSRPTDLPGWDVRAVAAHLAHLESSLAGNPQPQVEVAEAEHIRGPMSRFTEEGPLARVSWSTDEIVDELEASVATRHAVLTADPPSDASATADGFAALLGWTWLRLLTNRPLDLWVHEQDIRRAVGRPGGLESPGAAHVARTFAAAGPVVLAKRAAAPVGTTWLLEVTGAHPQVLAYAVTEGGLGTTVDRVPADPTVRTRLDFEDWIVLCAGRRPPATVDVEVTGDEVLAARILAAMAVTP